MIFFQRFHLAILGILFSHLLGYNQASAQEIRATDGFNATNIQQGILRYRIRGGIESSPDAFGNTNLFHSFERFSVPALYTVEFFNDQSPDVQNIIGLITGDLPSNIRGTIAAGGGENFDDFNLFLINPNGIVFGPGANLNLNGAFVASTSEGVLFRDGSEFSVNSDDPLLTINVPVGIPTEMRFGTSSGNISLDRAILGLNSGNFVLVGNEITINNSTLRTEKARIELGSISPNTTVAINPDLSLSYAPATNYQNISLSNESAIRSSGGSMQVRGQNILIQDGSSLAANPFEGGSGGLLEVYASGQLQLSGFSTQFDGEFSSGIYTQTTSGFDAGDVYIEAPRLTLQDGAVIITSTNGAGESGDISIVTDFLELFGRSDLGQSSRILSQSVNNASSAGGNINIAARNLLLADSAKLSVETNSAFSGGNILIGINNPIEQIDVLGSSQITTSASKTGDAGNIQINAVDLNIEDRSQIAASSVESGGGDILLQISNQILLNTASQITTSTIDGQGGEIEVAADTVSLQNNSIIESQVTLNEQDLGGSGIGGKLEFSVRQLNLNNSSITTSAIDNEAGAIQIEATNSVNLANDSIIESQVTGQGTAGSIDVTTRRLIADNSQLSTSAIDNGSGAISVNATDSIDLTNESNITSVSRNGTAGTIRFAGGQLNIDRSTLSTRTRNGIAGEVNLDIDNQINLVRATVLSNSVGGRSGRIEVTGDRLSADRSTISTGTVTGQAGSVEISIANQVNLNSSIVDSKASGVLGIAGSIDISTEQFTARGSDITTSAIDGDSGTIAIDATDLINLSSGSNITSRTRGGESGEISLSTGQLNVGNSAISTSTTRNGQAGIVGIDVSGRTNLIDSEITSQALGRRGFAGDLILNTGQLHANGSDLSTSAVNGGGGEIAVNATDSIDLNSGSNVTSETRDGDSGQLSFVAREFNTDNSRISTSTESGQAGQINIRVADQANLQNFSVIESRARRADGTAGRIDLTAGQLNSERSTLTTTTRDGTAGTISFSISEGTNLVNSQVTSQALDDQGNAGGIDFNTRQFFARNSRISTSAIDGDSGAISIDATVSIDLNNQTAIVSTSTRTGKAGFIDFTTQRFSINDSSADVQATTSGTAGELSVTASTIELNNGSLTASAQTGVGGAVSLQNFRELILLNGSNISTSATTGQAGNITLQGESAPVTVDQNSQIASTAGNGGTAGGIEIGSDTQSIGELNIFNGSGISVSAGSANQPGTAGNISIYAALLNMDENASITATTGSGLGGSIDLDVANGILLRNNSDIRTTAYGAGNGGNMTIVAPNGFILALLDEDSDIVANSISGNGGFISADALGIYGFRLFKDAETPESDFTANSVFGIDGTVILNTRDNLQPEDLPADVLRDDFLAGCAAIAQQYETGQEQSRFVVSGWGGLAATADALLSPDNVAVDLATWIDLDSQNTDESTNISSNPSSTELFREELLFGSNCQGAEQL